MPVTLNSSGITFSDGTSQNSQASGGTSSTTTTFNAPGTLNLASNEGGVLVRGSGGGGGGTNSNNQPNRPGGQGGQFWGFLPKGVTGNAITVNIGGGGGGGGWPSNSGGGGTTSIDGFITGNGGNGVPWTGSGGNPGGMSFNNADVVANPATASPLYGGVGGVGRGAGQPGDPGQPGKAVIHVLG